MAITLVLVHQDLRLLTFIFGLEALNFIPRETDVFLIEGDGEEELLEKVGERNDFVITQVGLYLFGGLLGELLTDLFIDEVDCFVAVASFSIVAVLTEHQTTAGALIKVVGGIERVLVIGLNSNGFLDNIFDQSLPGQSQCCCPDVVSFLVIAAVQPAISLHSVLLLFQIICYNFTTKLSLICLRSMIIAINF